MPYQDIATKPIRDFVIALGSVNTAGALQLEGTGFIVGQDGIVVTAAHVADALRRGANAVALFVHDGNWKSVPIVEMENHPSEDAAVLRLFGNDWSSIYRVSDAAEFASQEIMMWGYPERVALEIRKTSHDPFLRENGVDPDLIYMKGYIRRRLSRPMQTGNIIGSEFFEISEAAGSCYSGAPVIPRQPRRTNEVIGIYIGEETAGRGAVGIVVRCQNIAHWTPTLTGRRLADEKPTHV